MLFTKFVNKPNVIIFGDYNTRSKVDDTCLPENGISTCSVAFNKNAENSVFALENDLNLCNIYPQHKKCNPIRERLLLYDFLNQVQKVKPNEFREDSINFMPSYKIDNTGNYRLSKSGKNRLAGYADRILVKGNNLDIVKGSYKKLSCLGNDHFPLILDVNMVTNMPGGKTKKKKTHKKKTHKKKTHKKKTKKLYE